MQMTFRWYGDDDPVKLKQIRQVPVIKGIVGSLFEIPVGKVWPVDQVRELKNKIEEQNLELSAIESIPVHEDIKLGKSNRDKYIENYAESIRNVGKAGIDIAVYNFMPVFDWTRSELYSPNQDGSKSMLYNHEEVENLNIREDLMDLPAWAGDYTQEELDDLMKEYSEIAEEDLWKNLKYFLEKVVPVAEESGVRLAIHPDDPPWSIFGLPRIIKSEESIKRVTKLVDSPANGISLCTGSLGANRDVDLPGLTDYLAARDRLPFIHIRNIKYLNEVDFKETAHPTQEGNVDVRGVVKALADNNFDGIIRPDHGRKIWEEESIPGYGLYDRALGSMYLYGLWEAFSNNK